MCGIAGLAYFKSSNTCSTATLKRMADAIAHRGPDAEGFHISNHSVGLAHRRLSIIDLSNGDQPIGNEDGSIQIVFNGEIYNHQSLRKTLRQNGHVFKTDSDTETILHLYEDVGKQVVTHLRGMFAFAIWDSNTKELFLARDHLGQKPLYYFHNEEKFLFGSEIKAILAEGPIDRTLNPISLDDYLYFGFIPGSKSIFNNISKLEAGTTLTLNTVSGSAATQKYWSLQSSHYHSYTPREWIDRVEEKLIETVETHTIADVPVGTFLSGGLDSSLITALYAGNTNQDFKTFSIGFEEREFSELDYADIVAKKFNTQHTEEIVTADAISALDTLVHHYDEPFADPSAIPTMKVSELASRHVKVVLSGDGGDEAFGGYARYAHDLIEAKIRRFIPKPMKRCLFQPMSQIYPKADWAPRALRWKTLLKNLSLSPSNAYANTLRRCPPNLRQQILTTELQTQLADYSQEQCVRNAFGDHANDPLRGMLAVDTAILLPDDFLTKVDRASMAFGLEVRPPLVDHELMQLAWMVPSQLKVCKGETKWILKKIAERKLPRDIIYRKKQGFEIPIDEWLRGPLKRLFDSQVLANDSAINQHFNTEAISNIFRAHCNKSGRHGELLWSLLVLARWMNRYLG